MKEGFPTTPLRDRGSNTLSPATDFQQKLNLARYEVTTSLIFGDTSEQ